MLSVSAIDEWKHCIIALLICVTYVESGMRRNVVESIYLVVFILSRSLAGFTRRDKSWSGG